MEQLDIKMQSDSLEEFAKAMCEVQKNELFAKADSENPYYKSRFANLPSVWKTIRKPLTDQGFSVIQTNVPFEGGVAIVTTLLHISGQWIRGILPMPSEKRTPQAFGSVMSFERRYALMAIVGVSTADDDDDAESAMDRNKSSSSETKTPPKTPKETKKTPVLNADDHTKIAYMLPGEDSQAMKDMKEYKPSVEILDKDNTKFKIGKFLVEISADGKHIWSNVPKFNDANFDIDSSVPCAVAGLVRAHGVAFISGKYNISFTSEVSKDGSV